jgi:hypothetical protein
VILRPEDDEDMWHVYNLIAEVGRVREDIVTSLLTLGAGRRSESSYHAKDQHRFFDRILRFISGQSQSHPFGHKGSYMTSKATLKESG